MHPRTFLKNFILDNCIVHTPVTLRSGRRASWYADLRQFLADNTAASLLEVELARRIPPNTAEICAVPTEGLLFLRGILSQLGTRNLCGTYTRSQVKPHGLQRPVEGAITRGPVVLLEGTISEGTSSLDAAKIRQKAGTGQVTDVVAILDRQLGGASLLAQEDITLTTLFTTADLGLPLL